MDKKPYCFGYGELDIPKLKKPRVQVGDKVLIITNGWTSMPAGTLGEVVVTLPGEAKGVRISGLDKGYGLHFEDQDYLAIGDRVRPGPSWSWGVQDGGGLGTVEKLPGLKFDKDFTVRVRWDNGFCSIYRMNQMHQDLELVLDELVKVSKENPPSWGDMLYAIGGNPSNSESFVRDEYEHHGITWKVSATSGHTTKEDKMGRKERAKHTREVLIPQNEDMIAELQETNAELEADAMLDETYKTERAEYMALLESVLDKDKSASERAVGLATLKRRGHDIKDITIA